MTLSTRPVERTRDSLRVADRPRAVNFTSGLPSDIGERVSRLQSRQLHADSFVAFAFALGLSDGEGTHFTR